MDKLILKMFAVSFAVAMVSTNANAESTLQEDIDNGAVPLTTSELHSVFINNTQVGVGAKWAVYYIEDGKRIIAVEGEKTKKRKWWIDAKKGWCVTLYKNKKKACTIVYRTGQNEYRVYDKKGKNTHTFTMEQGDTRNLN